MTYTQVLNKCKRVLESCHTEAQLKVGKRYCHKLMRKLKRDVCDIWVPYEITEEYKIIKNYQLFDNFPRNP